MGGVSQCFAQAQGSGVDLTLKDSSSDNVSSCVVMILIIM